MFNKFKELYRKEVVKKVDRLAHFSVQFCEYVSEPVIDFNINNRLRTIRNMRRKQKLNALANKEKVQIRLEKNLKMKKTEELNKIHKKLEFDIKDC